MAYAALMTLSKAIDLILPHDQEYIFLCEKEQMKSLQNKVICLQEFLEHVSRRPSSRKQLEVMEGRIRETAYQLEDIVESILVGSFQQDVSRKSFYKVLASRCVPHCGTSAEEASDDTLADRTIVDFASCIEEVDVLLKDSMEMKKALNTNVISKTIFPAGSSSSEPPASADTNVGLEDDFIQILDRITNDVSSLQIIPITGMGGIGKTTLAKAVYDCPGLESHFDLRLWVTVSQEWNIQDILQGLLPEKGAQNDDVASLTQRLYQRFYGRRYLIVLDDVWHEVVWDQVKRAFPDGNEKSRVIVTTRLLNVGRYVTGPSSQLHQMQFLSPEQSWNLLREKVYGGNEHCHVELENIGKAISRNCKGLPLAVVVIGGLLKFNKTKNYWEEVAQLTTVRASMGDESLLEILSLSYRNLPPHLKACFLYFGMFREDEVIKTEELVRLWSAEGFLKPRESKLIEEVAEECLEELVERCLVLVKKRMYNGKIETSSIHDVLRDFSLRESEKEKFLQYCTSKHIDPATYGKIMKEQRRVSFPKWVKQGQFSSSATYTTDETLVRSFINDGDDYWEKVPSISFIDLKLLRVLRVVGWTINYPLLSILCSRLTNLRYLELELEDGQRIIPKSISKLRNLETLIISTYYLIILPLEIWMMPRLRHLIYNGEGGILPEPRLNGTSLESLQTLSGIRDQCFTKSVIDKILNLRRLEIEYVRKEDANEYGLDNLVHLHILQHLSISCRLYSGPGLTNFVFPQKLKELCLQSTKIPWEKMVSIGELPHLQWLRLWDDAFVGEVWEPSEGQFCQLKYLIMYGLDLEEWRAESTHFPSLEELGIILCSNLKEVPIEIGEIDTLNKLTVNTGRGGNKSLEESVERIKDEQELNGNHSLQVIIVKW